jgi:hypothetical protein
MSAVAEITSRRKRSAPQAFLPVGRLRERRLIAEHYLTATLQSPFSFVSWGLWQRQGKLVDRLASEATDNIGAA